MSKGVLSTRIREQVSLAVAEANGSRYCLSFHEPIAKQAGLSISEIALARRSVASDNKASAILKLARSIVLLRGKVSERDLDAARYADLTEAEIVEVVTSVGFNILTNYLNLAADRQMAAPKRAFGRDNART